MKKKKALEIIAKHRDELRELALESIAIFGSVARDEATESSDIDILVQFSRPVGLFHFALVRRRLSKMLGCEVDLVTPGALRNEMRDNILNEAVHAA
jgi:predicted nucleotidyltransferase